MDFFGRSRGTNFFKNSSGDILPQDNMILHYSHSHQISRKLILIHLKIVILGYLDSSPAIHRNKLGSDR